ncbi:MAG: serine/threonine-protein kinase [Minicystis sp.]
MRKRPVRGQPIAERAAPPPSTMRLTGRILGGRYRVGSLLGAGAMGRVYRAEHVELGRPCAVKVIRPPGADDGDDAEARFRLEALAAARLDHPNVLRVLDFGREPIDGLLYLVTEQLEGADLADTLAADGPLPAARLARLGRGICAALQHAHNRGVIHRDLKPENVLLVRGRGDDGEPIEEVKILDFGTALIDGEDVDTPTGLVLGTPAYMSPEQAAGAALDPRTDLYALGVLLFELATGRLPFDRATPEALATAHAIADPPRPSSLVPTIDRDIESIILACLRKRPRDRPRDARAVRERLGAVLARLEGTEQAPAASGERPVWPMVLRVAKWAASLAGVVAALLISGPDLRARPRLAGARPHRRADRPRSPARQSRGRAGALPAGERPRARRRRRRSAARRRPARSPPRRGPSMTTPPTPVIPYACPACGRRYVVVAGEAAPESPSCGCGAALTEAPLAGGVYEIRRARRASQRPRATQAEPDHGYGESHGYGPAHGGPTGPGDAPAADEPKPKSGRGGGEPGPAG